jgi:hypothetical protein
VLRNVILAVVLVTGLVAGYFFGSLSGRQAKDALKAEEQRSAEAKKESELALKSLQDKMGALVSDHNSRVESLGKEKAEVLSSLEEERKGRSKAIQDANASRVTLDKRMAELDALRRAAQPGSQNRQSIEAEMGRVAAENAELRKRVEGLECGKVPLPVETLQKFTFKVS